MQPEPFDNSVELIAVAKVARPHGIRGEVVADILTDFPERFDGLADVTAILPDGKRRALEIESFRFQKGRVLIKFGTVDTVEEAELLRNAEICVDEAEVVELEAGEFFDWELEGCAVQTVDGNELGKVTSLMRTGGTELLVVKGDREYLIPFAEAICTEVDIENKSIVVDPPEGLLEF